MSHTQPPAPPSRQTASPPRTDPLHPPSCRSRPRGGRLQEHYLALAPIHRAEAQRPPRGLGRLELHPSVPLDAILLPVVGEAHVRNFAQPVSCRSARRVSLIPMLPTRKCTVLQTPNAPVNASAISRSEYANGMLPTNTRFAPSSRSPDNALSVTPPGVEVRGITQRRSGSRKSWDIVADGAECGVSCGV